MPLTHFPKGVSSFGIPLIGSGMIPPTTGTYYFVHSGTGNAGNTGLDPKSPLATLDQAINKCTASKGDIVVVMPGHAENISAAGSVTMDVIGVQVIGLGSGNLRPTFTWSATAGTWLISAASCSVKNIVCKASIDSVVTGISISAAGVTLDAVDFIETASCQMLVFIQTSADADQLTIQNCRQIQVAAGSAKWIDLVGADDLVFRNNYIMVNASTHVLGGTTTESLNVQIHNNTFCNAGVDAASVILLASTTGMVTENYVGGAKSAIAGSMAIASCYGGENYVCNTANKNGLLDPVVDS